MVVVMEELWVKNLFIFRINIGWNKEKLLFGLGGKGFKVIILWLGVGCFFKEWCFIKSLA